MQLGKTKRISGALASATCALLGAGSAQAEDHGWKFDTAVLLYDEKDRVQAVEPVIKAQKTFAGEKILNLKLVVDSLTGASPNGAAASNNVETYTRPSGRGDFTVPAGEIPLDDTFKDSRAQFSVGWEQPINRLTRYSVGANISNEYDYQSLSFNAGLSRDFNRKNTTASVGLSFASDTIDPQGGIPTPYSQMTPAGEDPSRESPDDSKTIVDIVLGATQVINPNWLMQLNYSLSQADGYLNDPFKGISQLDETGRPVSFIYESRPDSRSKNSLFWGNKYHLGYGDTVDLSYRYMTDDWDITSHTIDFRYRWNITPKFYVEPHLRFYQQSEAEFYRHSLAQGETIPTDISADYRLADFDATTIGAKFGYRISRDKIITFRAERYEQSGNTSTNDLIGIQKSYDAFPELEATIVQIGYSFKW